MKALRELGLSVPDDVSVVGFDDLNFLDYFPVPLTTVRVPKYEMGAQAAQLLLRQMQGNGSTTCERISLKTTLVVRSSTAPPPA